MMNPKCFIPNLKPVLHKEFAEYIRTGETDCPINVEISPCGYCNAECGFCFYGKHKDKEHLKFGVLYQTICDFVQMGTKAITWTGGGEPTLHPEFGRIIDLVEDQQGIDQGLFTNAIKRPPYDPATLKWIRVSKTNQDWPQDNIKVIDACCSKVGLCLNYTGEDDLDAIETGLDIASKSDNIEYFQVRPALGVEGNKIDIDPTPIYRRFDDEKLFVTEYKFVDSTAERGYNRCCGYHLVPFIWHNGDVGACGYQRDGDYIFGNIYQYSFHDIWDQISIQVDVNSKCQVACKNHELNKLIHKCKQIEDINFI